MKRTICAVALTVLALVPRSASSGPLVSWGGAFLVPEGDFVSLAAGGALQTLAIRADGTLYLSELPPVQPPCSPQVFQPIPTPPQGRFLAVGMGRNHALAIRPDGSIATWGKFMNCGDPTKWMPASGQFVAVAGGSNHSVA